MLKASFGWLIGHTFVSIDIYTISYRKVIGNP